MKLIHLVFGLVMAVAGSLSSVASAGSYILNAFSVSDSTGQQIFTNRDVRCVSFGSDAAGNKFASFTLIDVARRDLLELTRKNKGKKLVISVCGKESSPMIQSGIAEGVVGFSGLTGDLERCLSNSFEINTKCSECPVCKN